MKHFWGSLGIILALWCTPLQAGIHTEWIEYKDGDTVLEGYLVFDEKYLREKSMNPAVIVVHDWMGFGAYANGRAEQLAQLGYVALAVDIYGKGVRPKDVGEASQQAGLYKSDRTLLRRRALSGYEVLKAHPLVDPRRIAAIGYCFGGTTVLEMARSGADLAGVVSFHGGLSTPTPQDAHNIKAKVLVLHGADDPYVPPTEVAAFEKEMNEGSVDWQMIFYSGAVHSFTHKGAGNDNSKGAAYNEKAEQRSWEAMKQFFQEIFAL